MQGHLNQMSHSLILAAKTQVQTVLQDQSGGHMLSNNTSSLKDWAKSSIDILAKTIKDEFIQWLPNTKMQKQKSDQSVGELVGDASSDFKAQLAGMANQYMSLSLEVQGLIQTPDVEKKLSEVAILEMEAKINSIF